MGLTLDWSRTPVWTKKCLWLLCFHSFLKCLKFTLKGQLCWTQLYSTSHIHVHYLEVLWKQDLPHCFSLPHVCAIVFQDFDRALCCKQLRYSGMMETIRIRRAGYPIRHSFYDFVDRYRMLASGIGPAHKEECKAASSKICQKVLAGMDYQLGRSKVFLKVTIQLFALFKYQHFSLIHVYRCKIGKDVSLKFDYYSLYHANCWGF